MLQKFSPALRLAVWYFLISAAWILLSDKLVIRLVGRDANLLNNVQSIKGIVFVVSCSFFLYFVARRYYLKISKSLHESEEMLKRYHALGLATKEGIIDLDLTTDKAEVNDQMRLFMHGNSLRIEHFSVKNRKKIHPDDLVRISKNWSDTIETRANIWQIDFRFLMPDGTFHDMIGRSFIIRDENNVPVRLIAAVQDVSEIRNIKTAMFRQELKHRQSLGQSIIKTQEEERNRWALELHDNVCQLLTVVKLYLEQLNAEPSNAPVLLPRTKEMTEKALNDIRQLSASIKPPEFSITSLEQAIGQLLSNIQRVKTYDFRLCFREMNEANMKNEQKLMVFRVVQEQLNNIIKYGDATEISIRIKTLDGVVTIEINDNGQGFDTSRIESGIGLRNIRSRLEVYAGNLIIDSAPGKGCRLKAEFSLV